MAKAKVLRNFSGPKGMIYSGLIIEVPVQYVSDWTASGLIELLSTPPTDPLTFKTMKTKKGRKDA